MRVSVKVRLGLVGRVAACAGWAGLLGGVGLDTAAAMPPEAVLDLLRREGVDWAEPALQDSAAEALFQTVDPQARILTAEEARWVERQRQGWLDSQSAEVPPSGEPATATLRQPAFQPVEYWPGGLAYFKAHAFYAGSAAALNTALTDIHTASVFGVIWDLRGVGGGDLEAVAEAAQWFCPSNELASVQDHAGQDLRRVTQATHRVFRHPLMILIDGKTREAAELLAALCRGQSRVMLIGTPTGGAAYLRDLMPLADGRVVDFARYRLRPLAAADYQGRGVVPDIEVPYAQLNGERAGPVANLEKDARGRSVFSGAAVDEHLAARIGSDLILRRAVDLLMGLKALEAAGHANAGANND